MWTRLILIRRNQIFLHNNVQLNILNLDPQRCSNLWTRILHSIRMHNAINRRHNAITAKTLTFCWWLFGECTDLGKQLEMPLNRVMCQTKRRSSNYRQSAWCIGGSDSRNNCTIYEKIARCTMVAESIKVFDGRITKSTNGWCNPLM